MAEKETKSKTYKWPKALGACADKLYALRAERQAAQKVVDGIEAQEKSLKEHIIDNLPKSEASGVSGKVANVRVITKEVPQVEDWDRFYAYVSRTKSYHLLQRRLSDAAVKEVWDDGKTVPGVKSFNAVTVSLTKL